MRKYKLWTLLGTVVILSLLGNACVPISGLIPSTAAAPPASTPAPALPAPTAEPTPDIATEADTEPYAAEIDNGPEITPEYEPGSKGLASPEKIEAGAGDSAGDGNALSGLSAVVESRDEVVPSDETDHGKTVTLATPAPDLIIEGIIWSPENPSIRDKVTFTVTIKNQGSEQAGSFRIAYYINNNYQDATYVSPVEPGATATKTFTWTAEAGSHTINAIADSGNKITESNETNNDKTFAFSVIAPDLIIESITWSPESSSVQDKVTFTVTIKNQGNRTARYSHVDFFIDGISRGYRGAQMLGAGANVSLVFLWNARAGSHEIKAVADILSHVPESDESNNARTVIYGTLAPDLVVQTITQSPTYPSPSDNVTFSVTIKNEGSGKSYSSHVAYYIDGRYLASDYVSPLNPGGTFQNTFVWTAEPGPHTFLAVADSADKLAESDETNNTNTISLPTLFPDLIVQGITWSPSSPTVPNRVTFTVIIKNQGHAESGVSLIYFYIDTTRYYVYVQSISPGSTVTKTFNWTAQAGSHTVRAMADAENNIIEDNESNNEKTATISPSLPDPPDLVVQSIVWSPENPVAGDTVTFTVTVKNQGSGQAGWFSTALYIDDTYLIPSTLSLLSPGATGTINFPWEARAGPHIIKAIADSSGIIKETDENNNIKTVELAILAPDLFIRDITWTPVQPSIGDTVFFTVTIKNQGNVKAGSSQVAYYIDGSSRGYHTVQEMDAGATVTKTFSWTAQAGSHVITAVADMGSLVAENDESNNETVVTLNISPAGN